MYPDNLRVLVVEDDQTCAFLLKSILARNGYGQVDVAVSGRAAIEMAKSCDYDVALVDYLMEGMNGVDVCREFNRLSGPPVIFTTGVGDDEVLKSFVGVNPEAILTKPISEGQLVSTMELVSANCRLRKSLAMYRDMVEHSPALFSIVSRDFRYEYMNRRYEEVFGFDRALMVGRKVAEVFGQEYFENSSRPNLVRVFKGEQTHVEARLRAAMGYRWFAVSFFPIRNATMDIYGAAISAVDVTDRKAAEEALVRLATLDELTGVRNRRGFLESLEAEFCRCRRLGLSLAVMMLDVDDFKKINDTWGHGFGDQVLTRFAAVVQGCLRRYDVLGRLGGEEFCILLPEVTQEGAKAVAGRVLKAISGELGEVDGRRVSVTASIGLAFLSDLEHSHESLLSRSDEALYEAKSSGKNTFRVARSPSIEHARASREAP